VEKIKRRKRKMKKIFAIEATVLILGTLLLSGISSPAIHTNKFTGMKIIEKNVEPINDELSDFSCFILTPNGVIKNTKNIPANEAQQISAMLKEAYKAFEILRNPESSTEQKSTANITINTVIMKLREHDLIPETMSNNQVREVMSGEFGKNFYERLIKKSRLNNFPTNFQQNGKWMHNTLCFVFWTGGDEYDSMHFLSSIPFDALMGIIDVLIKVGLDDIAFNLLCSPLLFLFSIPVVSPKFLIPYAYGDLVPWGYGNSGSIETIGLLGKWDLSTDESSDRVRVNMIGGIGLWFINSAMGIVSQDFMGFAFYIRAKKCSGTTNLQQLNIN
jgi:hypothetical protein